MNDLLKKVRKIEIKTKKLSHNIFAGQYHSAFKGKGMAFSEVREYNYGDEIRSIDWNVTARFNHPYVKIFEEEREMTVVLIIDISGSTFFGTNKVLKSEIITEIAAVLSFSAIANNDKVGVIFFSDKVEKYIPPKKGSAHILRIIRELLMYSDINATEQSEIQKGTSFSEPLKYFSSVIKKRATCFFITDSFGKFDDSSLRITARKHDLSVITVRDKREYTLPKIGLMQLKDAESDKTLWIDTNNSKQMKAFAEFRRKQDEETEMQLKRLGIDNVTLQTNDDYIKSLMKLFSSKN
ncbi:MAG: DUF58 domain-containing protein [Bacteroidales bacterium]|jgi:uncharacterized protein (DUF58 family)|nr:DUF58 domain-containing protein [Bacteroidales bacterium]